jgi:hypothetical protein
VNRRDLLTGSAALALAPLLDLPPCLRPATVIARVTFGLDVGAGPSVTSWAVFERMEAAGWRLVEALAKDDPRIVQEIWGPDSKIIDGKVSV